MTFLWKRYTVYTYGDRVRIRKRYNTTSGPHGPTTLLYGIEEEILCSPRCIDETVCAASHRVASRRS